MASRRNQLNRHQRVGAAALACLLLLVASEPVTPKLEQLVLEFVRASQRDDGGVYIPPPDSARADLSAAVMAVAAGEQAGSLTSPHAYETPLSAGVHLVRPTVVPDGRGWGLYVTRHDGLPVAVEIPHPRADLRTEGIGAKLAARVDARYLLVAGTHRNASSDADVAHERFSLFAAVHRATARAGVPAVQVHGFAARTNPDADAVVSPGSAALSPLVTGIADALEGAGFRTCRAWKEACGPLAGTRNVQGAASAEAGTPFVHLEVSSTVREERDRSDQLVTAVADAVTTLVAPPSRWTSQPADGAQAAGVQA